MPNPIVLESKIERTVADFTVVQTPLSDAFRASAAPRASLRVNVASGTRECG
jgi:hypothetical protein